MIGRNPTPAALGCALAFAFAAALAPAGAFAQSEPTSEQLAGRRVLIEQAVRAQHDGQHPRALELALRAGAIQMTPSLRALIAQEQQAVGQLGAALGSADLCVREADRDATLRNRDAILSTCRQVAASVRQQAGFVTVRTPSPAPANLHVTVHGEAMEASMLGVPAAVQPGTVVVEATAEGQLPFRREVNVAAGDTVEVPLELQPDPNYHPPAEATPVGEQHDHGRVPPPEESSGGPVVGPVAVAALGVVGVGVGLAGYVLQGSALSGCSVQGDTAYCPDQASLDRARQAPTYNTLGTVATIAGGVLIVAGAAWFVVGSLTGHESRPRAFRPRVMPAGVGFVF